MPSWTRQADMAGSEMVRCGVVGGGKTVIEEWRASTGRGAGDGVSFV